MKVWYFVPYSLNKDLGKAYNDYMSLIPNDNDWACFMDGDIMFLSFDWGHAIHEAVKKRPNAGIITCYTNRISKSRMQLYGEDSHDILVHRLIAKKLDKENRGKLRRINKKISGFLMVIQKKTWRQIGGFREQPGKILDVDGLISRKILGMGKHIYLMEGLYVLHYYRMAEGRKYKDHLKVAADYLASRPSPISQRRKKLLNSGRRNARIIKNRKNGRSVHIDRLQRGRSVATKNRVVQEEPAEAVSD